MKAYAELIGSKDPTSRTAWYRIYFDNPKEVGADVVGPFRDKTDAENAAYDEAKRRQLELDWVC